MMRLCLLIIVYVSLALIAETSTSISPAQFREDDNTTDRCHDLMDDFAEQASKFSLCTVTHARPIQLCRRCLYQFKNVTTVYDLIHKANNSKGQQCEEVLLNSDRLGVIQQVNSSIQDLWNKGNCQSCYNINETTGEYLLSKNTVEFIERHSSVMGCINNHTHREDTQNSTVCSDCEKEYCDLNAFYNKLKDLEEDAVCMDIVDSVSTGLTKEIWDGHIKAREDLSLKFLYIDEPDPNSMERRFEMREKTLEFGRAFVCGFIFCMFNATGVLLGSQIIFKQNPKPSANAEKIG